MCPLLPSTRRHHWTRSAYWDVVSPPAGAPSQSNLVLVRRSGPILLADWGLMLAPPIEGSTVAVFGCGCVGLSCVNAASLVGASRVIAIDVNPEKESWARKFGATDFINPKQVPEGKRIQDYLVELTDGGLDYTFDATGNVRTRSLLTVAPLLTLRYDVQVDVMRAALESCHKGWGVSTIIGVAAAGKEISTRP
jgi:S-(hydroxymethyl)glutathione dehydrogenase/alcohol dehydrogenase